MALRTHERRVLRRGREGRPLQMCDGIDDRELPRCHMQSVEWYGVPSDLAQLLVVCECSKGVLLFDANPTRLGVSRKARCRSEFGQRIGQVSVTTSLLRAMIGTDEV